MEGTAFGDELLSMREAAAYLKYEECTFRASYAGWGIPSIWVGGNKGFYKADLDKWAAGRKRNYVNPKFLTGGQAA